MKLDQSKKSNTFSEKPRKFGRKALFFLRTSFIALLVVTSSMGCTVRLKGISDSSDSNSTSTTTASNAPTVSISAPSGSTVIQTSGTVTFTVTTTGSTSVNLTAAQVTLNTTGGATCTKSVTNGMTTSATVTLSNCSGAGGTVSISIAAGIASNADGDLSGAVGPSSSFTVATSAFTQTWPFNALSEASYTFDASKMNFTGGVCRLTGSDQVDDGNTATGFLASGSGGTAVHTGTTWDSANNYLRLTQTGSPTNNAELDQSWTPEWSSLVAYWKMNNNWNDSKGTNNGTAANGATFTTSTKMGSHAGTFDGTDDYVEVPAHASLSPSTEVTFSAWIYPVAIDEEDIIIERWNQSVTEAQYIFSIFPDNTLNHSFFTTGGGAWGTPSRNAARSTGTVQLNTWSHVVSIRSGTNISFYINGVLAGSSNPVDTNPYMASTLTVRLGGQGRAGRSRYFNGRIDEVAIWNKALTATQVATLYSRQGAKYAGTLTSRVMDAFQTGMSWTTFSWVPTLPFYKELTDYASGALQNESSTDYSALVGSTGATGDNDLMSGLKGLWHLNETAGTTGAGSVIDDSGQGKHATPTNITFGGNGKLGGMASYNGTSSSISTPTIDLSTTDKVTVSLWYYSASTPAASRTLFESSTNYNSFTDSLIVYHSTNRKISCSLKGNAGYSLWTAATIPNGEWTHIACIYDTSLSTNEVKVYINGVLSGANGGLDTNNSNNFSNRAIYIGTRAGTTDWTTGGIDEVALWSRVLNTSEIQQLYRRGANRLKHQVRVCTASDCSDDSTGANWKGPDGTNQTYFSELNNNSTPLAMTGDVQKGLPSMLFSNFTSPVGTSRYFQYRTILESDDTSTNCNYGSGATWCSPELKSVTVDPTHYDSSSPTVVGKTGVSYLSLATFTQTLGASCASGIGYNLGVGANAAAATWYWWDSAANSGAGGWVAADGTATKSNTAATINTNAATFGTQVGTGTVYFKAFLKSSGTSACELDKLDLTGNQ